MMCIPCAAPAAPGILIFILMLIVAMAITAARYGLPVLAGLAVLAFRWVTGERLLKGLRDEPAKPPLFTRGVRAATRNAITVSVIAMLATPWAYPIAVLLLCGVGVATGTAYRLRDQATAARPVTGPQHHRITR